MSEEIGFENGRNPNFQGLVTLTLTLDPAIRHTVVHHSSTSTYIPNFIQIEETLCGWTDGHFPPYIIRSTFGSRPKNAKNAFWDLDPTTLQNSGIFTIAPSTLTVCRRNRGDTSSLYRILRALQVLQQKTVVLVWPGAAHAPIAV